MINQFISIRSSAAINTNSCEDAEVDTESEAVPRLCLTVDGISSENSDCDKINQTHEACEVSNETSNLGGELKEHATDKRIRPTTVTKTEMKINFSVDRLLSKVDVDSTKISNANKLNGLWKNGQKSVLTIDQLLSPSIRDEPHQPSKQIVRPMPMRYLQSTTTPAAVKSATTMYSANGPQSIHMQHYFKYINSNTSNLSSLQYSKQPQQQMPSVANSSGARYLDTFVTHNSSFASTENLNAASSMVSTASSTGHVKRKRSWSRAVFSQLQRKGLEIQFQIQKYITKPDRRKLAARLGLTDAQVKVWFQNRRMKWRHTRETKLGAEKKINRQTNNIGDETTNATSEDDDADDLCSGEGSSDEDEIDVVAE